MKTLTLKEFGAQLPVVTKDVPVRPFSFRPWSMKEEKEIAALRKKTKSPGAFVRQLFDVMLDSFNGQPWQALRKEAKKGEHTLVLNQLPYGNILYMYMVLRQEAMGSDFVVGNLECPECGAKHEKFVGDLDTLEVDVAEDGDPAEDLYPLTKPFRMGDVMVTGLYVRYTPWDVMEKLAAGGSDSEKQSFIQASVVAAKTDVQERAALNPIVLTQSLAKREIESLYEFINVHNAGPRMTLDIECDKCGAEYQRLLNWNYDHFFGSSSLPSKKTRSGRNNSSSSTTSPE